MALCSAFARQVARHAVHSKEQVAIDELRAVEADEMTKKKQQAMAIERMVMGGNKAHCGPAEEEKWHVLHGRSCLYLCCHGFIFL